jgi:NTE family protein
MARLAEFWETVCRPNGPASGILDLQALAQSLPGSDEIRAAANALSATRTLFEGQQGFFTPRLPPPWLQPPGTSAALSWYDTAQLRGTLERLVDFDLLNAADARVSVGAVSVETGNFEYFDSARIRILPEHIMASGALPPGFPPVAIGNQSYWDGGLVSNTPLMHVLGSLPRHDTLAFQVDLWSARGPMPKHLFDVMERTKDIQYSSRTRMVTDVMLHIQRMRRIIRKLSERLTPEQCDAKLADEIAALGCDKVYNIIHLIYRAKAQEGQSKDYEFGLTTMRDHWESGLGDIRRTLARREWLERPDPEIGVVTHDVHRTASAQ